MADHFVCVASVVSKMGLEEKGLLKGIILSGKDFRHSGSFVADDLKELGRDVTPEWVSSNLKSLFKEGLGWMDGIKKVSNSYGRQLDITIKKVLVKSLNVSKPSFICDCNTFEGAVERETWITEKLTEKLIEGMDDEARAEIVKSIEDYLLSQGFDIGETAKICALFMLGSVTPLNAILATRFFGPSLAVMLFRIFNLSLGNFIRVWFFLNAFFTGPIGWGISIASFFPMVSSFINKRAYDKYILAVFIIGMARIAQKQ